jgi:hypothetical protein
MISTKKNKTSTFILPVVSLLLLFLLFNKFALADHESKKGNNSAQNNTTLKIKSLNLSVKTTGVNRNYFPLKI